jgi:hypothetical protein
LALPQDSMVAIAAAVSTGLGAAGSRPSQLAWFPPEGLVPGSIRFEPADVLGQSSFTSALSAKYALSPEPATLVVVPFATPDAARAALAKYQAFLGGTGKPVKPVATPGEGGFAATDGYYGLVVAVRSASSLVIAVGASSDPAAAALLSNVIRRLPGSRPAAGRQGSGR